MISSAAAPRASSVPVTTRTRRASAAGGVVNRARRRSSQEALCSVSVVTNGNLGARTTGRQGVANLLPNRLEYLRVRAHHLRRRPGGGGSDLHGLARLLEPYPGERGDPGTGACGG